MDDNASTTIISEPRKILPDDPFTAAIGDFKNDLAFLIGAFVGQMTD